MRGCLKWKQESQDEEDPDQLFFLRAALVVGVATGLSGHDTGTPALYLSLCPKLFPVQRSVDLLKTLGKKAVSMKKEDTRFLKTMHWIVTEGDTADFKHRRTFKLIRINECVVKTRGLVSYNSLHLQVRLPQSRFPHLEVSGG